MHRAARADDPQRRGRRGRARGGRSGRPCTRTWAGCKGTGSGSGGGGGGEPAKRSHSRVCVCVCDRAPAPCCTARGPAAWMRGAVRARPRPYLDRAMRSQHRRRSGMRRYRSGRWSGLALRGRSRKPRHAAASDRARHTSSYRRCRRRCRRRRRCVRPRGRARTGSLAWPSLLRAVRPAVRRPGALAHTHTWCGQVRASPTLRFPVQLHAFDAHTHARVRHPRSPLGHVTTACLPVVAAATTAGRRCAAPTVQSRSPLRLCSTPLPWLPVRAERAERARRSTRPAHRPRPRRRAQEDPLRAAS